MGLLESDVSRSNEVSAFLNSIISSSEEARELVLQMIAYRDAGKPEDDNNVTTAVRKVLELLRTSEAGSLTLQAELEDGLVVHKLHASHLQNILLRLFSITRPSFRDGAQLDIKLRLQDYNAQACACCYQPVDGFFIEVVLQDTGMEKTDTLGNSQPLLHLANDLSEDEQLLPDISELHDTLKDLNGHIMVHADELGRKSWHLVMEASGSLSVESRASLENFRRQRRKK